MTMTHELQAKAQSEVENIVTEKFEELLKHVDENLVGKQTTINSTGCKDFAKCAKNPIAMVLNMMTNVVHGLCEQHAINPHDFQDAFIIYLKETNDIIRAAQQLAESKTAQELGQQR